MPSPAAAQRVGPLSRERRAGILGEINPEHLAAGMAQASNLVGAELTAKEQHSCDTNA